ncbi:hypothetical protein CDAR_65601 [Caerostris darwini]|uniref:Uncharacterized protein n=1 Tax=Caerostris darwini TaxID=1538125 RepID=A0AAV4SD76_9ARAC|nr:hypothetical protein CDAR_65601 [Caerostris darwini]
MVNVLPSYEPFGHHCHRVLSKRFRGSCSINCLTRLCQSLNRSVPKKLTMNHLATIATEYYAEDLGQYRLGDTLVSISESKCPQEIVKPRRVISSPTQVIPAYILPGNSSSTFQY